MDAQIIGTRYVLAVQNLKTSRDFYKHKLGFTIVWEDEGWVFLVRDNAKIMIGECPDDMPAADTGCHSYFAYFEMKDIDNLYKEFLRAGVIHGAIENKPWGQREFSVRTIDGHRMTFGETVTPQKGE